MAKRIGYARVSTKDQKHDRQLQQLEAAGCDKIYQETLSGSAPFRTRQQFNNALAALERGDTLVVTSLDRLGRSIKDTLGLIEIFEEKGIELNCLNQQVDTNTPLGKGFFLFAAMLAEVERDVITERVKEGLRASSKKSGRPTKLTPQTLKGIRARVDRGLPTSIIAKELALSDATVKRGYKLLSAGGKKSSVGYCVDHKAAQ